jgi:hypothetical protein
MTYVTLCAKSKRAQSPQPALIKGLPCSATYSAGAKLFM